MLKAIGKRPDGGNLLLLGLSRENMRKLLRKQPLFFDCADLGLTGLSVTILGGETEADITRDLRQFGKIDERTKVVGEPE